jgi:uncharacterized membrane protein
MPCRLAVCNDLQQLAPAVLALVAVQDVMSAEPGHGHEGGAVADLPVFHTAAQGPGITMISLQTLTNALRRRGAREVLFLVSIWLKGFDALLELIGGLALFAVSPALILRIVRFLTQDEIAGDPRDLVANALRHAAGHLTFATEHFVAIYLLVHGAVKLALVWALLARVLVAYPASLVIFAGFIVYQLYRYSFTHGVGLLAVSAFDLVVIGLIFLEYRALRRSGA